MCLPLALARPFLTNPSWLVVCSEASPPPALGLHPIYVRSPRERRERRGDQQALACALLTNLTGKKNLKLKIKFIKIFKKGAEDIKKKKE
jgi:hypothetical protein